ncbi:MAG: aminopeptidase P N-terminal domain-containing protein, partial [Rhodothermales bacterium]
TVSTNRKGFMKPCTLFLLVALLLAPSLSSAQHYQTDFPPEEFQARWHKVFDQIGDGAVALVQGYPQTNGFAFPRQYNNMYYLSGIETPHAYILLDGRTRETTLYLPPRNERLERSEGKVLSADDVDLVKTLTGAHHVKSTDEMVGNWLRELLGRPAASLYVPQSPSEGYAQSRYELLQASASIAADYWDGRIPQEQNLVRLITTRIPNVDLRNLTPILDAMRLIKSEREIDLIRRASQLAGLGMMEAIRSTEPGLYEYQLDAAARYVFLINDARLDGYRSITASGTDNIRNGHYYRNNSRLKAGDLVLMDYAPDYKYYVSDIGRMWPVNGTYSPVQRELLGIVLAYYKEILQRIRPGVTARQIMDEAAVAMEPVLENWDFSKPIYEAAARRMVETGGGVFSHPVGMAVHDVGRYKGKPLVPGLVFSLDPALRVPEEQLYYRYEDTIVITETGFENFTDFLPMELDDIEALMREEGVLQKVPPTPAWK